MTSQPTNSDKKPPNEATALVDIARDMGRLYRDETDNTPFIAVERPSGATEVRPVDSHRFKNTLSARYYQIEGKAPNNDAISSALKVLSGLALNAPTRELSNRVAGSIEDRAILHDLGTDNWTAISITENEWQVTPHDAPFFHRYGHQRPIPEPAPPGEGDLHRVLDYVNINDEDEQLLFLVTLVTYLAPDVPRPILVPYGPQGSAKTTLSRVVRRLIDPSAMETLTFPGKHKTDELVQKLAHNYIAPFDNISWLNREQSDTLCRAVTGEGFAKRKLYTDDQDVVYTYRRCIILNGIDAAPKQPDLLDRAVFLKLSRIPVQERMKESRFWHRFEGDQPTIQAGIYDTLSQALAILPEVEAEDNPLPRMADYAELGEAISRALGHPPKHFLEVYQRKLDEQNRTAIEVDVIGDVLLAFIDEHETWTGYYADLLTALTTKAEDMNVNTNAKNWPSTANVLSRRLNELEVNLNEAGITRGEKYDSSGRKQVTLSKKSTRRPTGTEYTQPSQAKGHPPPNKRVGETSSASSVSSARPSDSLSTPRKLTIPQNPPSSASSVNLSPTTAEDKRRGTDDTDDTPKPDIVSTGTIETPIEPRTDDTDDTDANSPTHYRGAPSSQQDRRKAIREYLISHQDNNHPDAPYINIKSILYDLDYPRDKLRDDITHLWQVEGKLEKHPTDMLFKWVGP